MLNTIARLKTIRQSLGWSQERCAHELGVTLSSIHRWEYGVTIPRSRAVLHAIDQFVARHASSQEVSPD